MVLVEVKGGSKGAVDEFGNKVFDKKKAKEG